MFGSEILDVAIGLIFVYILVSIICSAVREAIEGILKSRAAYLEYGIRELLQDKNATALARDLFEHPLIFGLFSADKYKPGPTTRTLTMVGVGRPSYIPSKTFATALLDLAARGSARGAPAVTATEISDESIRANLGSMPPQMQRVLLTMLDSARGDLELVRAQIEAWYDGAMDRVSGWYKRTTHWILFVIGLVVAITMNIDTLAIVRTLYKNDATRAALVAAAVSANPQVAHQEASEVLKQLKLPIGRQSAETIGSSWKAHWPGWLLTAFAVTLGAPFWFDVLNKVMVIRSTVKPREKSPEEGSEDRQPDTTAVARTTALMTTPLPWAHAAATEGDLDGCDVAMSSAAQTSDDQLPPADGGVA